jgi:CO/xanthine dehydrogenase Mo-binding subunit
LQAVLTRAGAMIGWDKPRRKGVGRGIALAYADNSACAEAVEVEVKGKQLKINRIVCAMDCGLAIDPAGVEAQISGGIVFGLQAALFGEVPFAAGAPQVSNFSDYRMPLLGDTPPIEVALLAGSDRPGSVGESSVPPMAPALVNAIANAGGPRIRSLPVSKTLEV